MDYIFPSNLNRIYHRVYSQPLDDTELYESLDEAQSYAENIDGTAYVGQIITVVDEETSAVTVYKINFDRTLSPIGETVAPTGGTIDEEAVRLIVNNILNEANYITSGDTVQIIDDKLKELSIPSKVSELDNDAGYITKNDIPEISVPTKISELENDKNYLASGDSISKLVNDAGYLTEHQDLSDYTKKKELSDLSGKTHTRFEEILDTIENVSGETDNKISEIKESIKNLSDDTTKKFDNVNTRIDNLPQEIKVYKGDEKTISETENENGETIFSVKQIEMEQVSGLTETIGGINENIDSIKQNIVGIYHPKGSVQTYDDLPKDSGLSEGDVYNVVEPYGDTPAGTNYAWVKINGEYVWDALGGTINLSSYQTKEESKKAEDRLQEEINSNSKKINSIKEELTGITESIDAIKEKNNEQDIAISAITEANQELANKIDNIDVGIRNIVSRKIFNRGSETGFTEFAISMSGETADIQLNGFDGGEIII